MQENQVRQRATTDQQQELVRYLTDLNQWLSRDVNQRRNEIRGVEDGIENLRNRLHDRLSDCKVILFSVLLLSSSALPDWLNLPPPGPPAPPAPLENIAVVPPVIPWRTPVTYVSESSGVVPPSPSPSPPQQPRPPSSYPQYRQEPIAPPPGPPPGPPWSYQSMYPPPLMPPPVISAPSDPPVFGTPDEGMTGPPSLNRSENIIIRPAADAVIQPPPIQPPSVFPPPTVAASDLQQVPADPPRTRQDLGTPHMPPVTIDIESASGGTASPPLIPLGHTFGSPPVSMTRDRSSRRSHSRSRHPVVIEQGSPHSPSRGSPGSPSRSSRSHGRAVVVEEPRSRRSHSRRRSRSPLPALVLPQPSQPTVIMATESRGRPRHRTPSRRTALDRPHSYTPSQSPSSGQYRPQPSHRDSPRRPHSPIIVQQPAPILQPGTGVQPSVVPFAPPAQPVMIIQEPAPSRRLHRSHRRRSRTPPPQRPVVVLPPGRSRSRSWERPRNRRNFLQRLFRGRSYERSYDRDPYYGDYDARDRDPRYYSPSRHSPSRRHERRHERSPVRYSPESRRHRRRRSYSYPRGESPPRTSRRSPLTIIPGPGTHSSRRRGRGHSPPMVVTQGERGGRSYRQPTMIFPEDDDRPPSRSPISMVPSHHPPSHHPPAPSIEVIPSSLYSERRDEWEVPHPLVSAY